MNSNFGLVRVERTMATIHILNRKSSVIPQIPVRFQTATTGDGHVQALCGHELVPGDKWIRVRETPYLDVKEDGRISSRPGASMCPGCASAAKTVLAAIEPIPPEFSGPGAYRPAPIRMKEEPKEPPPVAPVLCTRCSEPCLTATPKLSVCTKCRGVYWASDIINGVPLFV